MVAGTASAQLAADELSDQYKVQWADQETSASTVTLRGRLAADLLTVARGSDDTSTAVLLCQRSFHWARKDPESFAIGAQALDHLQQTNPSLTLEALLGVKELHRLAYRSDKSRNMGKGIGYADASMQVAEQRFVELDEKRRCGEIALDELIDELEVIVREHKTARNTAGEVMKRARRMAQSRRRNDPIQYRHLRKFIRTYRTLPEQIEIALTETTNVQERFADLKQQLAEFEQNPTAAEGRRITIRLLVEFNAPKEARLYAEKYLDSQQKRLVALPFEPVAYLNADDAHELGQWYGQLAQEAEESSKPTMLQRAHRYLSHAKHHIASTTAQKQVQTDLKQVNLKLKDLGAPATAAPTTDSAATPSPTGRTDERVFNGLGRPWTRCSRCGLIYSPIRDESQTLCQRCTNGRRSIFHFD